MSVDNITKLREIQLELLEKFIDVCRIHEIEWYAMFGTLLGVLRGEGYLPWDDDIDVVMPEKDYNILCEHKEWFSDKFYLQTPADEGFSNIAKLRMNGTTAFEKGLLECLRAGGHHGISIDIIPLIELQGKSCYHTPSLINQEKKNASYPLSWFYPAETGIFEHLRIKIPAKARKVLNEIYGDWCWPNGAEECKACTWFFDTENSYEKYFKRYTGLFENIEGKEIFLFGAADSMRIWLERFGLGEQVKCVFDNSPTKWGTKLYGFDVCDPKELIERMGQDSRLIVVSKWHQEIGRQLEAMGIDDYYVFLDYYFDFDKDGNRVIRDSL